MTLPTDPAARKAAPVCTGVLDYFPDAIVAIAQLSQVGNDQHNPGQPLHWDRAKSGDEADALLRHLMQRGTFDTDGVRHSVKVAWRALALAQKEIEAERAGKHEWVCIDLSEKASAFDHLGRPIMGVSLYPIATPTAYDAHPSRPLHQDDGV